MTTNFGSFARLCKYEFQLSRSSWSQMFSILIQPLVYSLIVGLLFHHSNPSRAALAVLGAGMMGAWISVLYASASNLQTSRQLGILEPIIGTPTSLFRVISASSAGAAFMGLLPVTIAALVGWQVFGLPMWPANMWVFMCGVLLFITGLVASGIFLAPIFVVYPHATALANMGDYPAFVIGGLIVPISFLPMWLHPIAYIFPPSWGVRLVQAGMLGDSNSFYSYLVIGFGVSIASCVTGAWWMRKFEIAALRRGVVGIL